LHASAVLNAKSFATSEYSQLFKKLEWRKRVRKKFEPRSVDLLILDRIELKPEYRGHGLGLLGARCLIEMFGSRCGLIACKPYPLQFEGSNRRRPPVRPSGAAKALRTARKKLRQYWIRVGFQRVPRTMLYALDPQRGLASFGQLLREVNR
jgi:GNAT superfamily N-acetyltransferase